jgi:dCMP deaminase
LIVVIDDSLIRRRKMADIWDLRFLNLAEHIAGWSKDPSTQTGAVIVDKDRRVVSVGYNGIPKGIEDEAKYLNDREIKYATIIHCEHNALIFAKRSIEGCVLYTWPFSSCSNCTSMFIQAGIAKFISPATPDRLKERWKESMKLAEKLCEDAGTERIELDRVT